MRHPLLVIAYYILGLSLLFIIGGFSLRHSKQDKVPPLKINDKAPDFLLKGIDGKDYGLKDFANAEVLVVIFTCNHCPTAQAYEDRIIRFTDEYKSKGVSVVAVSPNNPQSVRLDEIGYSEYNDTLEEMRMRAEDKHYNFPYLYDGDEQHMSKKYGAVATPHVFVFDKERTLQYRGRFDDRENPQEVENHNVMDAVNALLAKKDVAIKETKTFGCSIKWVDKEGAVKKANEAWAKEPVNMELINTLQIDSLIKNDSDKLRLINIWATWCGPCVTEFPDFVVINRMYRNRPFEFITISADHPEKPEPVLNFLKSKGAANRNYLFNSNNKYDLIEAVDSDWQGALPYTILVAPGGKILYSRQGEIDPLAMKKKILEHLGRYYF